jgi:hypothetical protein
VKYAYARLVANVYDKSKQDMVIRFTEKPVPRKYFEEPDSRPSFILWTVRRKAENGLVRGLQVCIFAKSEDRG